MVESYFPFKNNTLRFFLNQKAALEDTDELIDSDSEISRLSIAAQRPPSRLQEKGKI
jgi:hypothetical protein